jgi:glycosyltransferase involved in cell wall biosynthesis
MPLYDGAFERGKCGYKLLQYMACRRPVIASPVGVNRRLVKEGVNGFLAAGAADWLAAMRKLYGSAELRRKMGHAGRELVEKEYSVQTVGPRLANIVKTARQNWCSSHGTQALRGNAYENVD